jgi:L-rhamnose mutarotase
MQRYAMLIRLRPEQRETYLKLHAEVWPRVADTIRACNIRNYTIFLRGDLLIGYYEYHGSDHTADQAAMAADPDTQRWWALTDPCQEQLPDTPEGHWWAPADEVWHQD